MPDPAYLQDRAAATQPHQQGGGNHLDALVEAIGDDPSKFLELLGVQGPAPQAPQFQQQQYLPPGQAIAGSVNPQLAALFSQRQQFNQTGQYNAAQNAFGEQMQSRRAAVAGLTSMYGANQRAESSHNVNDRNRYDRRQVTKPNPETGVNEVGYDIFDKLAPPDKQYVGTQFAGSAKIQYIPYTGPGGTQQVYATPTTNGGTSFQPSPQQVPSGQPAQPAATDGRAGQVRHGGGAPLKQAPPAELDQVANTARMLGGLQGVYGIWENAAKAQQTGTSGDLGLIGQQAQDAMAQGRYTRSWTDRYGDPEVAQYYGKIKAAMYDYVKAQTGAQFSVTEMDRYLSLFPTTTDTPERAKQLIEQIASRAINDINLRKKNWQSIQTPGGTIFVDPAYMQEYLGTGGSPYPNAASQGGGPASGKSLPESAFQRIADPVKRQQEMQRFVADGGTITQGQ